MCDAVSPPAKMFQERQCPLGSFLPGAGPLLILCLVHTGSPMDCTGYRAMGHHVSHLLSIPEPNSFLPDPHISEWMQL